MRIMLQGFHVLHHKPSWDNLFLCMEKHHVLVKWNNVFKVSGPRVWTREIVLGCVEASRINCNRSLEEDVRMDRIRPDIWGFCLLKSNILFSNEVVGWAPQKDVFQSFRNLVARCTFADSKNI